MNIKKYIKIYWVSPVLAQLVEHLTVVVLFDTNSYQNVAGSIPADRKYGLFYP